MSWFRTRPKVKEPPRAQPHRSSPTAEKMLDEAKKTGVISPKNKTKPKKL